MSIKTNKYKAIDKKSNQKIRAVRVTEKNINELAEWAGKAPNVKSAISSTKVAPGGDVSNHKLKLHLEGVGIRVVRPGDFLLKLVLDDGKVDSWVSPSKEDDFEQLFTLDK